MNVQSEIEHVMNSDTITILIILTNITSNIEAFVYIQLAADVPFNIQIPQLRRFVIARKEMNSLANAKA